MLYQLSNFQNSVTQEYAYRYLNAVKAKKRRNYALVANFNAFAPHGVMGQQPKCYAVKCGQGNVEACYDKVRHRFIASFARVIVIWWC